MTMSGQQASTSASSGVGGYLIRGYNGNQQRDASLNKAGAGSHSSNQAYFMTGSQDDSVVNDRTRYKQGQPPRDTAHGNSQVGSREHSNGGSIQLAN